MTVWTCQQSGDCCRDVDEVVMTPAERDEIERAAPSGVALSFLAHADPGFVRLSAHPCPLLVENACSVYAVRPYNCRRWGCGRKDVKAEPFVNEEVPARFYTDRAFRREYVVTQRHAQRWARSHGWAE